MDNGNRVLLDTAHTSDKGTSIRITLPRKVVEKLEIIGDTIIGFYMENEKVYIQKLE